MTISIRDARTTPADRRWIEGVYREYLDDLAPDATGVFPSLDEIGHTESDQLARWFGDPAAQPMTILQAGMPVGFAIVARGASRPGRSPVDFRMAEFFVARGHRRLGVGEHAVRLLLDRFAGRWEIVEVQRNHGAVDFWRRTIRGYTRGDFVERIIDGEVRQTFVSGGTRSNPAPGSRVT
ncbi:MAG: GNAT family N-acetyltransferase [Steroidobacteraceae bacterium]